MAPLNDIANLGKGFSEYVPDGTTLGDAMSRYFLTFSDSSEYAGLNQRLRWVVYSDWIMGTELFAACLPMYDESGVSSGQKPSLLGVTCIDVNMVVDIPTFRQQPGFANFQAAYEADTRTCANGNWQTKGDGLVTEEKCAAIWKTAKEEVAASGARPIACLGVAFTIVAFMLVSEVCYPTTLSEVEANRA